MPRAKPKQRRMEGEQFLAPQAAIAVRHQQPRQAATIKMMDPTKSEMLQMEQKLQGRGRIPPMSMSERFRPIQPTPTSSPSPNVPPPAPLAPRPQSISRKVKRGEAIPETFTTIPTESVRRQEHAVAVIDPERFSKKQRMGPFETSLTSQPPPHIWERSEAAIGRK